MAAWMSKPSLSLTHVMPRIARRVDAPPRKRQPCLLRSVLLQRWRDDMKERRHLAERARVPDDISDVDGLRDVSDGGAGALQASATDGSVVLRNRPTFL